MNQDKCKHEWLVDPRKDKTQYCRKCFKWTGDKKKYVKSHQAGSEAVSAELALLCDLKSQVSRNAINDLKERITNALEKDCSGEWELIDEVREDYQNDLIIIEKLGA